MKKQTGNEESAVVDPMPATVRLAALSRIAEADKALLAAAAQSARVFQPNEQIVGEGAVPQATSTVLSGWAIRVRCFSDGRRQILGLLLPGDLLGHRERALPLSAVTITAVTGVALARAPEGPPASALARAYAVAAAVDDVHLYRQIARLGRLSAYERVIDLMLEVHERLALAGLVDDGAFAMPLTQEMLGDVLGLTSVHVNRTLMTLRREGLVDLRAGRAQLNDIARLAERVEFSPVRLN